MIQFIVTNRPKPPDAVDYGQLGWRGVRRPEPDFEGELKCVRRSVDRREKGENLQPEVHARVNARRTIYPGMRVIVARSFSSTIDGPHNEGTGCTVRRTNAHDRDVFAG